MTLYRFTRGLHLYTSFVLMVFVLMYFVSGYVILHGRSLFGAHEPTKTVREAQLATPIGSDPRELQTIVEHQLGLHGKAMPPRKKGGAWELTYSRPGDVQRALVHPDGRVEVTESKENFVGTLNAFHRLHGYGGGGLYVLWAVLYDLASASMIVFALSGIYLWYKTTRRRALGWSLLAVSFAYAGGTIAYLVYAP